jgi:Gpi18-like mannosyltransferase
MKESKILNVSILFFFVLIVFLLPSSGHPYDMLCWHTWTRGIFENGLKECYQLPGLNYNPLFLYIMMVFGKFQGSVQKIDENMIYLKAVVLLFDFAGIYLVVNFFRKNNITVWAALLILINIAYLYNTVIWGQVDCIHTNLVLAAILAAFYRKSVLSFLLLILAINMKLQAIIFVPVLFLITFRDICNLKTFLRIFLICVVFQLLILLPFIMYGKLHEVWNNNIRAIGTYPVASMNAFNLWYLLLSTDPMQTSDHIVFIGLTYKAWGLILFFLFSFITLLPLMIAVLEQKLYDLQFYQMVFLSSFLIAIIFFYFNTEMHERYIHPAIILCGLYAIISSDYISYILLSVGYVLNLEKVMRHLKLNHYGTFIFDPRVISLIFLIAFVWGLYKLYALAGFKYSQLKIIFSVKNYIKIFSTHSSFK